MKEAITAKALEKTFNGFKAVDCISFTVHSGEIFGFLGPNGAGKTTTVRMLTGVIKPDGGNASVMGFDVVAETLKARELIGVVPEAANAYPDLSAWKNMMLIASLYGIGKREAEIRTAELLKEFGIYERRNSKVKTLSKGMKQRLMLSMALVSDPELLFLDEPTSGLDVMSARLIREKIIELSEAGKTVFLTSHNMEEVNLLCERIGVINHGKIVTIDSPDNLRHRIGGALAVDVVFNRDVKLAGFPDAMRVRDGYRLYTTEPHDTICSIVDFALHSGLKIVSLNVCLPSLEDIFLRLTGEGEGGLHLHDDDNNTT